MQIAKLVRRVPRTSKKFPQFPPERMIEYLGMVNYATSERVIEEIRELVREDATKDISLLVTCAGGPSGTAMGFYDTVRSVLKPKLTTIGSGDVDSSGVVIFLAGDTRYVTKNTTLLFHMAGGNFEGNKRYTSVEIDAILREYRLKDFQYASIVAERSNGRLTSEQVLSMMEKNTILTPPELVSYGLADAILK
ncbi:MAG: ATP-dependent Clp protease, protease subunit [Candidatus Parcubacteria bacterium]|jgi:ATP-dependent protease ClpP protease subunit|nr:ATP-dependent Clp protease, protease subunit [Candidatus Parcubacteria bacterium]